MTDSPIPPDIAKEAMELLTKHWEADTGPRLFVHSEWKREVDAVLARLEPDPVTELAEFFSALGNLSALNGSRCERAHRAWNAIKSRLAVPALDEAAIRRDEREKAEMEIAAEIRPSIPHGQLRGRIVTGLYRRKPDAKP